MQWHPERQDNDRIPKKGIAGLRRGLPADSERGVAGPAGNMRQTTGHLGRRTRGRGSFLL